MITLKEHSAKRDVVLDRLKPENFDKFCSYYFDYEMAECHKEWFKYIFDENIKRLLVEAPFGHAKSTYIGVFYPIWLIMTNPKIRIILGSNTLELSTDRIRAIRNNFENNERLIEDYKILHGFSPKPQDPQKWTEKAIYVRGVDLDGPPSVRAAATNAAIAGKRCDVFIGDDLIDDKNSATVQLRKNTKDWFGQMALSRLEPDGMVRLMGTEYGEFTLYQDIIIKRHGQFMDWIAIVYKALDDKNKGPKGELWFEYWPFEKLMKRKNEIGVLAFELGYQNNPKANNEFGIFKESYLKYYSKSPEGLQIFQGADLAISLKENANYFALATIGLDKDQNIYLLDMFRAHLTFEPQMDVINEYYAKWHPIFITIEKNNYQAALPEHLIKISALPIKVVTQTESKEYRLSKLSIRFENGKIHIRPDMYEFIEEYIKYDPTDKTTSPDQLDSLDIALVGALENVTRKVITTIAGEKWPKNKWGL